MPSIHFFYSVKPFIPRWAQIQARRVYVRQLLKRVSEVWPIDKRAGHPPDGWTGWPEGKQFALVLTHDVEAFRGLQRCRDLVEMESHFGLRSAFYFVGHRYEVSDSLRRYLADKGAEVGVHGLLHDGKLFRSRKIFDERVPGINRLLKEWGAAGFRSPSMVRDLRWIGELAIDYDSSTFDTDPFEPQPEGAGTIFPFQIQIDAPGRSYVEIPYTLPQDSTLFVMMRERTIDIWKKKLAWIAEKGGMAVVLTHPDYMAFHGNKPACDEYPVELYETFIEYVSREYAGQYWLALPRDVASFWRAGMGLGASAPVDAGEGDSAEMAARG